jgi:hypothetical protein
MLVEKIEALKGILQQLEVAVQESQEPIADGARSLLERMRNDSNQLASLLIKKKETEVARSLIEKEIYGKLKSNPMYSEFSQDELVQIRDRIIEDANKTVLSKSEFRDYVVLKLRALSDKELVQEAYSPSEIEDIGKRLARSGENPLARGEDVLVDAVSTPIGRQDAINKAENQVLKDPRLSKSYLKTYYGL